MLQKKDLFKILVSLLILSSCSANKTKQLENNFGSFDLYGNTIVFSYFKNSIGSLFIYSLTDNSCKQITKQTFGWDNFPIFSSDGKQVLYVSYPNLDSKNAFINIINLNTKEIDTIIRNEPLILEVCFSKNNRFVYYLKASEVANYSPIARQQPHGIDIFAFEISTKQTKQITSLKGYSLQALTRTFSDTLLAVNNFEPDVMGMGLLSVTDGKFVRYKFQNDPRHEVNSYYYPISIFKDSLLYLAPYEIYKHDLLKNESTLVLRCPNNQDFGQIRVDNSWSNLYFTKTRGGIFQYNILKKELKQLNIDMKK
jgi:hypothetical protein